MQGKLLLCNIILSLIIFNVVAQDVENKDNDDQDFEKYKANLLKAVDTLTKDLNSRDVTHLQRRGWLKKTWRKIVRPTVTKIAVNYAVKSALGALLGKRISNDNEALDQEALESNGTQCEKDAAQFQEAKKAASQLCALTKFPDIKCP